MRRYLAISFILIVTTMMPQSRVVAAFPDDKAAQVDALMAQWAQGNTPGAAVMVIKDGAVLHKKGYGLANLETRTPIGANTLFNIASVAKQFTAMAAMILVERGKLSYADSLSKFFPEFPAYAQQITVRNLLNHTSGLADYTIFWKDGQNINKNNTGRASEDVLKFLVGQKKLDFAPGEKWRYSNSGYVLLTLIIGQVSGVPFPQFVKENIFQPLGMNDSFVYDENAKQTPNSALGYIQKGDSFKRADFNPRNFISGDDHVNTTIEDLYKWDQALYTEKLVKAATLKEALTSGTLNDGTKINYGFGWGVGKYLGVSFVSHSGGTDGFVAHIARFTEQHLTVIILSNFEQITPSYMLANKIAGIYLDDKPPSPAPIKLDAKSLADYTGNYSFFNIAVKVTVENDALWLISPTKKVKLVPVGEDEFIAEGSGGESSFGFNRNAKGLVTGLILLNVNGLFLSR